MSEELTHLPSKNNDFIRLARQSIRNSGSVELMPLEVEHIGSMSDEDGAEFLAYLMERHEAAIQGGFKVFLRRYYAEEDAA